MAASKCEGGSDSPTSELRRQFGSRRRVAAIRNFGSASDTNSAKLSLAPTQPRGYISPPTPSHTRSNPFSTCLSITTARARPPEILIAMMLSSALCSSTDGSFSSPPPYTPGTPASPSCYGPMMVRSPFFLDFGVGGEYYCCQSSPDYTPSSPPRRAGTPEYAPSTALRLAPLMAPPLRAGSPDYTPSTPSRRAASPDYTPSTPSRRAASPDYSPSTPSRRAASPDYTPSTPSRRAASPDYSPSTPSRRAASPDYTPSTPSRRAVSPDYSPLTPPRRPSSPDYTPSTPPRRAVSPDYSPLSPPRRAASPDYTPLSRRGRAASPDYTPSTPPPSPLVSDAESRTSPPPRRHHPYQRRGASTCSSRASRFSSGRRHRAFLHGH